MIGNILKDTTHQSQPSFAEVTAKAVARSIEQTLPQEQHKPDASATGEIASARVIFFPTNAPGMGRFKLFDLVGYS